MIISKVINPSLSSPFEIAIKFTEGNPTGNELTSTFL